PRLEADEDIDLFALKKGPGFAFQVVNECHVIPRTTTTSATKTPSHKENPGSGSDQNPPPFVSS
ncbi:MAG: hypothetical protein ABIF71_03920, partial [Planctomycetota bacterium]